eukprot:762822-Hanusia_phi.AAC.18
MSELSYEVVRQLRLSREMFYQLKEEVASLRAEHSSLQQKYLSNAACSSAPYVVSAALHPLYPSLLSLPKNRPNISSRLRFLFPSARSQGCQGFIPASEGRAQTGTESRADCKQGEGGLGQKARRPGEGASVPAGEPLAEENQS